ncbi:TDT family transporter [Terrabacter sp. 2RAF25]|uniref:SLAC1 family transporter n=1 Tax=Terrabacter sp. 2RAF25 TaxID=3232998 RepID=UPI003F9E5870
MTTPLLARPTRGATTPDPRVGSAPLPPVGPVWFPSVMGTGILSTLLATYSSAGALRVAAVSLLVVAWLLLLGLGGGFAARAVNRPERLRASVATSSDRAMWGTVAMGVLSVGSATLAVLPGRGSVVLALVLWSLGTALGLVTALGFTAGLVRGVAGEPSFLWGLPVVPPMVSATAGAALVPQLPGHPGAAVALLAASTACFPVALGLGLVVFAVGYHHHWRVAAVPVAASASAWIPLGIVGQSLAAAQSLATAAAPWLTPAAASHVRALAVGYGLVVLACGVPAAAWAVVVTTRGFARRMPFGPGWWALTFPVGTVSLGLHHLGGASGHASVVVAGGVVLVALCGTWTLCAAATARAVASVLTEWRGVGTGAAAG